jgi:hypothetical protein
MTEKTIRRRAAAEGLTVEKARARWSLDHWNGYRIVDANTGEPLPGAANMTLAGLARYFSRDSDEYRETISALAAFD